MEMRNGQGDWDGQEEGLLQRLETLHFHTFPLCLRSLVRAQSLALT